MTGGSRRDGVTRIGFIGLGHMGLPMANRLLDTDFDLQVFNRTAARAEPLKERGARVCASAADAAHDAQIAITMLYDDTALREIGFRLVEGLPKHAVHLSMSTVSP